MNGSGAKRGGKTPEPGTTNAAGRESLSGLVERVTFFNEENGFAVLQVKARGQRDLVTVVGSLAAATAGEWIQAEGRWFRDREYGLQFRAELLTSTAPTSLEGIEKYLGSGMIKGIGPVYARKLVAQFGAGVFDVIENCSARLELVEGIGPTRRRRIKEAWAEQKRVREIMVFLHSHGVGTSRAVRIYKTYGDEAIDKIRGNPYLLARDIPGIGFKTADQIARKTGVPFDSILRAEAGLHHVLLEATESGHCALPTDPLREGAIALLGVEERLVNEALERSLASRQLVAETISDSLWIYLPHLHRAEEGIARHISRLAAGAAAYPAIDAAKALVWCQERTGKILAPSQQTALLDALRHRMLIVTGGPGVGKTTLVQSILQILRAKRVPCLLCAPTGRAAKRLSEATGLEARTIHRLLEVNPGTGGFVRNEKNPLEAGLLVVDECSMVDVPLMHHLLRAVPEGASLLLVGDVDQLPSVGPGSVLRDLIQSGASPVARLTEVFRQAAESRIIRNAHRINRGDLPELSDDGQLTDFYFIERDDPAAIANTLVNLLQERIPRRFGLDPVREIQVLTPMNRGRLGVRELNPRLQEVLNPRRPDDPVVERFGFSYRIRDKVMQIENNYEKDVFNGDIGEVRRIDPVEQEITLVFDRREVPYAFTELDEVQPAYAITIHKSQGSEYPAVVIPLAMEQYVLLQRNLIYTAITRGRRLVVLVGQKKALALAIRNDRSEQRFSGLLARLRAGKTDAG